MKTDDEQWLQQTQESPVQMAKAQPSLVGLGFSDVQGSGINAPCRHMHEQQRREQMDATTQEKTMSASDPTRRSSCWWGYFRSPFMRVINGGVADVLAGFG